MFKFVKHAAILTMLTTALISCQEMEFPGRKAIRPRASISKATKASEISNENLTSFLMDVNVTLDEDQSISKYQSGIVVKKQASTWKTFDKTGLVQKDFYWKTEGTHHFWCFAPIETEGELTIDTESPSYSLANKCVFTFTPSTTVATQDDIVISYSGEVREFDDDENITGSDSTNAEEDPSYVIPMSSDVDIKFHHALSEVCFALSTDDDSYSSSLGIKDISIEGVAGSGVCTFIGSGAGKGMTWDVAGATPQTYTITINQNDFTTAPNAAVWKTGSYNKSGDTYNLYTTKNLMFLIPEDLDGTGAKITVTFLKDSIEIEKSVELDDEWLPGYFYKYKINAIKTGADIFLKYELQVADWVDGSDDILL